jgi:hypothetical protein
MWWCIMWCLPILCDDVVAGPGGLGIGCIVAAGPAGGALGAADIEPPDIESGAAGAGAAGIESGAAGAGAAGIESGAAGAGAAGAASCANTAPPARAVKTNAVAARVVNFMVMVPFGCS